MKKNFNDTKSGSDRYIVGEINQFDQKNEMFKRMIWDPEIKDIGEKFYMTPVPPKTKQGYHLKDFSMINAAWHLEDHYGNGIWGGKKDLYGWDGIGEYSYPGVPRGLKIDLENPQSVTDAVRKAGQFYGAAKVGMCKFDRRWLYSRGYTKKERPDAGESFDIDLPEEYKYAIVLLIEMDYNAIACSPAGPATAATGIAYSKMAFSAGLLANFIRGLGYKAIPCGNDTACSIPMAIDAGLGELARNGLLITPDYGPRVRICKVFTDMPLLPDRPIEFGVWDFCMICKKCAKKCPSQALSHDEPTDMPHDISNRKGVKKWHIRAKKCARFWASQGIDCSNCIRSCPFNKPPGVLHDTVRWFIRNVRPLHRMMYWMDELFGYGRQQNPENFWEK